MNLYAQYSQPNNTDNLSLFLALPSDVQTFMCTGYTDLRQSIDGLSDIVEYDFGLNPLSKSMYLFCGRRINRLKILYHDGIGNIVMVVRSDQTNFQWPRSEKQLWKISRATLIRLLKGEKITDKDALRIFQIQ